MNGEFPLLAQALEHGLEAGSAGGDVEAVLGTLGLQNAVYHSFEPPRDRPDTTWITPSAALTEATPAPVASSPLAPSPQPSPSPESLSSEALSSDAPPSPFLSSALPPSGPVPRQPLQPQRAPDVAISSTDPAIAATWPAAPAAAPPSRMPAPDREVAAASRVPAHPAPRMAAPAGRASSGRVTMAEVFRILSGRPAIVLSATRSLRDVFGAV